MTGAALSAAATFAYKHFRLALTFVAVIAASTVQLPGHAQFNQWQHKNSVHSSLSFASSRGPSSAAAGGSYSCVGCRPPEESETGCFQCYPDSNPRPFE